MSSSITKAGTICSQKMLVKLCEKVCRKRADMRGMSCVQSKTDTEKPRDTAPEGEQTLSPYLFLLSTNMSNTYYLPAITQGKGQKLNKTQALELLHCNIREKPHFGMGKRNKRVKNLNQNLGPAKGTAA